MTDRLTDAELDALAESITGNPSLWSADIDEDVALRAIAELRELRAEVEDCQRDCGDARSMRELRAENARLRANFTRQHNEQQELLDYYRKQNAKLVAAGKRLADCYELCLCPSDKGEPDCIGWKMLFAALASVKGEQG
jgi:hypothetical protein